MGLGFVPGEENADLHSLVFLRAAHQWELMIVKAPIVAQRGGRKGGGTISSNVQLPEALVLENHLPESSETLQASNHSPTAAMEMCRAKEEHRGGRAAAGREAAVGRKGWERGGGTGGSCRESGACAASQPG